MLAQVSDLVTTLLMILKFLAIDYTIFYLVSTSSSLFFLRGGVGVGEFTIRSLPIKISSQYKRGDL